MSKLGRRTSRRERVEEQLRLAAMRTGARGAVGHGGAFGAGVRGRGAGGGTALVRGPHYPHLADRQALRRAHPAGSLECSVGGG